MPPKEGSLQFCYMEGECDGMGGRWKVGREEPKN